MRAGAQGHAVCTLTHSPDAARHPCLWQPCCSPHPVPSEPASASHVIAITVGLAWAQPHREHVQAWLLAKFPSQ